MNVFVLTDDESIPSLRGIGTCGPAFSRHKTLFTLHHALKRPVGNQNNTRNAEVWVSTALMLTQIFRGVTLSSQVIASRRFERKHRFHPQGSSSIMRLDQVINSKIPSKLCESKSLRLGVTIQDTGILKKREMLNFNRIRMK
jgi:hypothetical protein